MAAYYNENCPKTAAWLRELITAGLIADGEVDTRSIADVAPADLNGFVQCHFFAGIGGWSYALQLAGWPDDRHVWTGSCPCQPWSMAGTGAGANDPRHLWPAWFSLIEVARPAVVFGEQVASRDGLYWLDLVYADMEAADYAIGAVDLCAAGAGAPHARARLWFVADTNRKRCEGERLRVRQREPREASPETPWSGEAGCYHCGHRADVHDFGAEECDECSCLRFVGPLGYPDSRGTERVAGHEGRQERAPRGRREEKGRGRIQAVHSGAARDVGHANGSRLAVGSVDEDGHRAIRIEGQAVGQAGATRGFWADCDWLWHRDGVYRAVEPGAFPLAARLPGDMEQIRAYGNAIVPQVAAEFISAYTEARRGVISG